MLAGGDAGGGQQPSSTLVFLPLCDGGSSRWLHSRLISSSQPASGNIGASVVGLLLLFQLPLEELEQQEEEHCPLDLVAKI
jgi:hypothetical protein